MRRNGIRYNDQSVHDGCGDGGERFRMTGLPGWLRDRIESVAIPEDRDLYFRDVVAALAGRGWDSFRIAVAIAGRGWIPERYAGRHLEWGIRLARALSESPLRSIDEAAPDDVAASDLRAVQRAIVAEGLQPPAAVIDATAAYLESEDAIAAWIDDRCERDASSWEPSAALFASWSTWAEGAGENAGSRRRFAQTLESGGLQPQRMRHGRGFLAKYIPVIRARARNADIPTKCHKRHGAKSSGRMFRENEAFAKQYARARDVQADVLSDEIHGRLEPQ